MLPNEEFALACRARYEQMGLVVDKRNGEFAHCPLPKRYGSKGYYLLWEDHQHQGLLQSEDIGECCFYNYSTLGWLRAEDVWPEGYFKLWDIYERFAGCSGRKNIEKAHTEKDAQGRSKTSMRAIKIAYEKVHAEKDDRGRSIHSVGLLNRLHAEKDELGRSVQGVRNAERLHAEKDELGRSVQGVSSGKKTCAQTWESTVDGFRGNPGNVAQHNKSRGWDPAARVRVW